ncbi:MAG: hypothetical protein ABR954_02270 [Dehalococcoidales bacterium]
MKKIIKKFWGVAFVLVMLSTLFVAAIPQASAGVLTFTQENQPNLNVPTKVHITANNTVIYEFVVGYDNTTVYAATSNGALKSIDAGRTWANLTALNFNLISTKPFGDGTGTDTSLFVAVAPDDVNYVAFMDQASGNVSLSKDGGTTFQPLGIVKNGEGEYASAVTDIDISPAASVVIVGSYATSHVVAVTGRNHAGTGPSLFYCLTDLIGSEGSWKDACLNTNPNEPIRGQDFSAINTRVLNAVKFSPAFAQDLTAYVVGSNASGALLHVVSFNNGRWNTGISGFWAGYLDTGSPIGLTDANLLTTTVAVLTGPVTRAQIAFDPNFNGLESETRTAYISLADSATGVGVGGIYRVTDSATQPMFIPMGDISGFPKWAMSSLAINSDGTVLVAAAMHSNKVWTLTSLASGRMCSYAVNNPYKRIGITTITDNQTVAYHGGTNLFDAKQSTEGAFSLSVDDGYTFNDISLVDTSVINIVDQVIAPDGGNRYVISNDNGNPGAGHTSVFYWDGTYWERHFTLDNYDGYVAKASPTDFKTLYLGDKTSAHVYYTASAGTVNWKDYQSPKAGTTLADLEVESDATLYVATTIGGQGYVSTLTENGRIWKIPVAPTFSSVSASDPLASLTLVSPGNLIAGSTLGRLAYSTDGGTTWRCSSQFFTYSATYAAATSLANGSAIYTVFDGWGGIYYWTVGTSSGTAWGTWPLNMSQYPSYLSAFSSGQSMKDILIYKGSVYAISSNASDTWLYSAFLPALGFANWGEWAATNLVGQALYSLPGSSTVSAGVPPDVLKVSADPTSVGTKLWFIDIHGTLNANGTWINRILAYTDLLAVAVPAPTSPIDKYLVQVNKETGYAYDTTLIWATAGNPYIGAGGCYEYQVAKDSAFSTVVLDGSAKPATLFAPTVHVIIGPNQVGTGVHLVYQPGETYYWRTRAIPYPLTGFDWYYQLYSNWSTVYTIEIQPAPPPVPELNSPANGGIVTILKPGFSWSVMSGEAPASGITMTYTFQLAKDAAFSTTSMVYTTTTTVAGLSLPVSLTDGQQYFWRVQTTTSVTGDWSTVGNFNVAVPKFTTPVTVTQTQQTVVLTQTNPPATSITVTAPVSTTEVSQAYIWVIIIIGAVLVIAIIVLIVRTRRVS